MADNPPGSRIRISPWSPSGTSGGSRDVSVSRHQILLEDVVAVWIHPLDPGNDMLPQKVLINDGIDVFAGSNENNRTFLAVATYHHQDHLLQWSLRFGRDADIRVYVGYREVRK
jgi:hypothetical protein